LNNASTAGPGFCQSIFKEEKMKKLCHIFIGADIQNIAEQLKIERIAAEFLITVLGSRGFEIKERTDLMQLGDMLSDSGTTIKSSEGLGIMLVAEGEFSPDRASINFMRDALGSLGSRLHTTSHDCWFKFNAG
jgi:hypothetical protein